MNARWLLGLGSILVLLSNGCSLRESGSAPLPPPPPGSAPATVSAEEAERRSDEAYDHVPENAFMAAAATPRSTFSIDVDTASYSNARRFLKDGQMPPADAVRIEEFVNYFTYDYPQPTGDGPFSVKTEVASCPWNSANRVLQVGLKGRDLASELFPAANLVFLIDTSGSMGPSDRLPLLKDGLRMLVDQLRPEDRVSIVTYAGSSGLALRTTAGDRKAEIRGALADLEAGGGTNGSAGIELAYEVAEKAFIRGGTNRVILATDGDFNVGVTSQDALVDLIERKRENGVFLTVLWFGTGNLKDSTMEKLADKGNGNYAYIDSIDEARKALGRAAGGTLNTIAKDVKIQVEFNPSAVAEYRLIGYENRMLADRDFNDDAKDAGEIGAGHTVTALYEIVPAGRGRRSDSGVDPLKYQQTGPTVAAQSGEIATIKLRYKEPAGTESRLMSTTVVDSGASIDTASPDLRFSTAVAQFGMLLRGSEFVGNASYDRVLALARTAIGADLEGERAEFAELVSRAKGLAPRHRITR